MKLVVAVTGASGAYATKLLLEKATIPVLLVASKWGKEVYSRECGPFTALATLAHQVYEDHDLSAAISSGSEPTAGMVILPCSVNTLAKIANGICDTLITRAAHCHLKEQRRLVLCVREAPWSLIDLDNLRKLAAAGAVIMPLCLPFYIAAGKDPTTVTMTELTGAFVEHVLTFFGQPAHTIGEALR